jgi:hypothetical protein
MAKRLLKVLSKVTNKTIRRPAVRNKGIALLLTLVLSPALAWGALFPPVKGDLCANIPFAFIVGSKELPAGNYVVRIDDRTGRVEICEEGIYCESVVTSPVEVAHAIAKPELAFRKYGDQYFLSQIWRIGRVGRHLPDSSLQPNLTETVRTWEAAFVEARPMCIHHHAGLGLGTTWH